jgi:hypothetical protein
VANSVEDGFFQTHSSRLDDSGSYSDGDSRHF